MTIINFYQETINALTQFNKRVEDVKFVTTGTEQCNIYQFFKLIGNFQYDNGFGTHYISLDLKIVGNGWWLERHEYDGSEGWTFKEMPQRIFNAPRELQFKTDYGFLDE
jgi:hypothetical protein